MLKHMAEVLRTAHYAQENQRWESIDCSAYPGMRGIRSKPGVENPWRVVARTAVTYLMKEVLMLQPRGSRLLVKRIDTPKPTSSLLVIPETVDGEASCYAIVLAIGNKVSEDVKVADTVILAKYCGSPVNVELDGETLEAQIVMEEDVLAVVGEE